MYDRICFRLEGNYTLPACATEHEDRQGRFGAYLAARLANFELRLTPRDLFVRGSLHKFHTGGENLSPFNFEDSGKALRRLEEELGFAIGAGRVTSMEVGQTLQVPYSPVLYLSSWGNLAKFTRATDGNGATTHFRNYYRSFKGYDKQSEAVAHDLPIPDALRDKHLIRLELTYVRRLVRIFKRSVTVADLSDPGFQALLRTEWEAFYFKIPKDRKAFVDAGRPWRTLQPNLAALGLIALGDTPTLLATIDRNPEFSASARSKLKRQILGLSQDPEFTLTDEINSTLDELVLGRVLPS